MPTIIDLHVHTSRGSSDSSLTPQHLVQEAKRLGLHGVCITEHGGPWDRHEFQRFAAEHDLLLIRGMELETEMGHILAFGLDSLTDGLTSVLGLRQAVDRVGGCLVSAHPFRYLHSYRVRGRPLLYKDGPPLPQTVEEAATHPVFRLVDAVEVVNGNTVHEENAFAWGVARSLGLQMTGASDAHSVNGLGRCVTVFEDEIYSEAQFLAALKAGRFSPAYGPPLRGIIPFDSQNPPPSESRR